jgi:hypothetical protein
VLLDYAETPRVEVVRIDCDIERTMKAILESDLPDEFAVDLRTGGDPGLASRGSYDRKRDSVGAHFGKLRARQ